MLFIQIPMISLTPIIPLVKVGGAFAQRVKSGQKMTSQVERFARELQELIPANILYPAKPSFTSSP